jgi:hypothetical protein
MRLPSCLCIAQISPMAANPWAKLRPYLGTCPMIAWSSDVRYPAVSANVSDLSLIRNSVLALRLHSQYGARR